MAGYTPKVSGEPAVAKAYQGCSIHEYTDKYGRSKTVMANKSGEIRNGTMEAMNFKTIDLLKVEYDLTYVMTVGEVI